MKCQDFSPDKNFIQWRYNFYVTCEGIKVVKTTSVSASRKLPPRYRALLPFSFTNIRRLKDNTGFSNELPKFDKNIFDDQQNERIVGRFVAMTDSEVDNLIETEGNANTKSKR